MLFFITYLASYLFMGYWTGRLVSAGTVPVYDGRKIHQLFVFLFPIIFFAIVGVSPTMVEIGVGLATVILMYSALALRRQSVFFNTIFTGIDRPEDRPYTLWLIVTQGIGTLVAETGLLITVNALGLTIGHFLLGILLATVADSLAEPIGQRWGIHRYRVPSLISTQTHYRSWEGSLAVFLSSLFICLGVSTWYQLHLPLASTLLCSLLMTICEARAPHTWDAPVMIAGYTLLLPLI